MSAERRKELDEKFCFSCGEAIKSAAEICPHCGVRQMEPPSRLPQVHIEENVALIPMLLNGLFGFFGFMGIGHMALGAVGKGIGLLLLGWLMVVLFWVTVWFFIGWIFIPLGIAVWVWSIFDVQGIAVRRAAQQSFDSSRRTV